MKPTRLILIPEHAADPAPYRIFDGAGALMERGEITLETARPRPDLRDVALAPGADVLVRWIEPSPGNHAQQAAAALWRLRDDLAAPVDRLIMALGPIQADGQLAAVTAASLLDAWRDYFDALHLSPVAVVPNSLVLPRPEEPDYVLTAEVAGGVALRACGLAAVVQADLVEAVGGDRRRVEADAAFEAALAGVALHPPVDLAGRLRGSRAVTWEDWRLAAGLAAALVLCPVVVDVAQALAWRATAGEAREQTRALAVRAWPDMAGATSAALSRRLSATVQPGELSAGAAALHAAVEATPGADLDAFGAEPGDGLNAIVTYPAFQDLDALKAAAQARGIRLEDVSTVEDAGRVVSDLRLERLQ